MEKPGYPHDFGNLRWFTYHQVLRLHENHEFEGNRNSARTRSCFSLIKMIGCISSVEFGPWVVELRDHSSDIFQMFRPRLVGVSNSTIVCLCWHEAKWPNPLRMLNTIWPQIEWTIGSSENQSCISYDWLVHGKGLLIVHYFWLFVYIYIYVW